MLVFSLDHLQTVVRAKRHTTPTVQADIDIPSLINGDGIHRTGSEAIPATDTEFTTYGHPAAGPLSQTTGGADGNAGCRVTGKAALGKKSRRETAGTLDTDTCALPGKPFIDQTGTGQGAGVAANTTIHMRGCENFHRRHPLTARGLLPEGESPAGLTGTVLRKVTFCKQLFKKPSFSHYTSKPITGESNDKGREALSSAPGPFFPPDRGRKMPSDRFFHE